MANEFEPLFALPSLEQYQESQKAADSKGMNVLQRQSMASSYDFARQMGYKSPEERKVEAANKVVAEAEMSENETDPLKRQFNVMSKVARSFANLGQYDMVQNIAPELARLQNQINEQRKLTAEAAGSELDNTGKSIKNAVDLASAQADVQKRIADGRKAGLDMKEWVNQDSTRYMAVNEADPDEVEKARKAGFGPYIPGMGADKEGLGKKPADKALGDVVDADKLLLQWKDISSNFDPAYLTWGGKIDKAWNNAKEMAGLELTAEQRTRVAKMSMWQRDSFDAMNAYIHAMTGAQMSQFETLRLVKGIPDPQRDGPTEYISKLRSVVKTTLAIRAQKANLLARNQADLSPDWWKNPANLPPVSEREVDAFLETNLGIPSMESRLNAGETRTYKGATYTLKPGADRKDPNSWVKQ